MNINLLGCHGLTIVTISADSSPRHGFCEGVQDPLHCFPILRRKSGQEGAKQGFLIRGEIRSGVIPSVDGVYATAVSSGDGIKRGDGRDFIEIAHDRVPAYAKFLGQIRYRLISARADDFQKPALALRFCHFRHLLPPSPDSTYGLTVACAATVEPFSLFPDRKKAGHRDPGFFNRIEDSRIQSVRPFGDLWPKP